MKFFPCIVLPFALLAGLPVHAADATAELIARIEGPQKPDRQGLDALTLSEVMGKFKVPALSIAVVNDFKIHWARAYGVADVQTKNPVTVETRFQAASISKPVFAMGVLKAVQSGAFSLDVDINTLLKTWKLPPGFSSPVTARSLLSHTSGADDGFGFPGYDPAVPRPTPQQILRGESPTVRGPVSFARAPYQAFKYSGGGFVIMQVAFTDRLGKPFADIMQDSVLAPLGMSASTYEQPLPIALESQAAHAHDTQGKPLNAPWHVFPEQAAAGLWTTPSDLARFVIEVQAAAQGPAGRVLDQLHAREMISPVGVGPYGVGLSIEAQGGGWYFSHTGSNWGYRAKIIGHLRKGYGMVIMTNSDGGVPAIKEIEDRVAAAYGWDSLDKPLVR